MNRRQMFLSLFDTALFGWLLSLSVTGKETPAKTCPAIEQVDTEKYRANAIEYWSNEIAGLEAKDKAETHPDDSILFVGSSSIRMWKDIATDMAPYHAIQRGYGGARWTDVAIFAERLITPHKFRAVVFLSPTTSAVPPTTAPRPKSPASARTS